MNMEVTYNNKLFRPRDFTAQALSDMSSLLSYENNVVIEEEVALTMLDEIPHNITVLDVQDKNVYVMQSAEYKTPVYFLFARVQNADS